MEKIRINSFAKINLSLDVLGVMDNGFHQVEMIMQQILLCDDVLIRWKETGKKLTVKVSTNKFFLPTDERNLAYKAAVLMSRRFGSQKHGDIIIDIKKRIPVAAGLPVAAATPQPFSTVSMHYGIWSFPQGSCAALEKSWALMSLSASWVRRLLTPALQKPLQMTLSPVTVPLHPAQVQS